MPNKNICAFNLTFLYVSGKGFMNAKSLLTSYTNLRNRTRRSHETSAKQIM